MSNRNAGYPSGRAAVLYRTPRRAAHDRLVGIKPDRCDTLRSAGMDLERRRGRQELLWVASEAARGHGATGNAEGATRRALTLAELLCHVDAIIWPRLDAVQVNTGPRQPGGDRAGCRTTPFARPTAGLTTCRHR